MKNIADTCFLFLTGLCPFSELWPFEKNMYAILSAKYLKTIKARALKLDKWTGSNE